MRSEERFDAFYLKTRRALVHQTFALTGDLGAAERAVRDAYVEAWHHWRKVSAFDDPRDWVRPRAWQLAQRRHTARLWHRTKSISAEHRAVLDALHRLPTAERRSLLLVQVAGVPLDVASREAKVTGEVLERHLQSATASMAVSLDTDPTTVRTLLASLGEDTTTARLPRAAAIRREGRRRRRTHTAIAMAMTTFLGVASGAFAYEPADQPAGAGRAPSDTTATQAPRPEPDEDLPLPSAEDMLEPDDLVAALASRRWQTVRTHDNTSGDGINSVCQTARFADPEGLSTVVREFSATGRHERTAVQTMEVSASDERAADAYDAVLGWYSGCPGGRLQLGNTYRVRGLGDEAAVLRLEEWRRPLTSYVVGLVRVGQVVTFVVHRNVEGTTPVPRQMVGSLAATTQRICASTGDAACIERPRLEPVPPPPSGAEPGLLDTVDLPGMVGVNRPWVGTEPAPARGNPSSTSCDRALFRRDGAVRTRTRTFLVPDSGLPSRFGLTETYGLFRNHRAATRFMAAVRQRIGTCEDRDLTVDLRNARTVRGRGVDASVWTLRTEVSEGVAVMFETGFVRQGNAVAQVTFVPAGRGELTGAQLTNLVLRAGDRLRELG